MREYPGHVTFTPPGGDVLAEPPDLGRFLPAGDPTRLDFETRRSER